MNNDIDDGENQWDNVFASYPSAQRLQRYHSTKKVVTFNKVLGVDLDGRDPKATDYCGCGNCQPMNNSVEAFCCAEILRASTSAAENYSKFSHDSCLCENETIKNVVENLTELKLFIDTCKWLGNQEDDEIDLLTKNYRFALYKKLTLLIHGPKQANERLPLPSCLVSFVRSTYPDEDEEYVGFLDY
uniref:P2X purinoreceptor 7 intracellular domain-containing protein n=1 Tax=Panagrolaimus davidi TaxID=227884 RepID=A0A914PZS7_9BILA